MLSHRALSPKDHTHSHYYKGELIRRLGLRGPIRVRVPRRQPAAMVLQPLRPRHQYEENLCVTAWSVLLKRRPAKIAIRAQNVCGPRNVTALRKAHVSFSKQMA